jgi:hypothetical protein
MPPQAAVDACAGLEAGVSCKLPSRCEGESGAGVCSLGPASTGPLACARAQELLPPAAKACADLAVGAACTLGRGHETASGTCVTPAAGGSAVCVVACAQVDGIFECGGRGEQGKGGDDDRGRGLGEGKGDGGSGSCPGRADAGSVPSPEDAGPNPV